eukprot:gene13266-biopygen8006
MSRRRMYRQALRDARTHRVHCPNVDRLIAHTWTTVSTPRQGPVGDSVFPCRDASLCPFPVWMAARPAPAASLSDREQLENN